MSVTPATRRPSPVPAIEADQHSPIGKKTSSRDRGSFPYIIFILATTLLLAGCDKEEPAKGSAPTGNTAAAPTPGGKGPTVSKWRSEHFATSKAPMGLVLEQMDAQATATLFELKGTNGFVLGDKLASGSYVPAQKAIILMMGNLAPSLMSVDQWLANGGPYMKIPFERGATNLAMTTVVKNGPAVTINLIPFDTQ